MLISDIKPYERNARHNEKAIPAVADSIREFSNDYSSGDSWKIPTGYAKWSDFSRKKDNWVGAIRSSASPFSKGYWQVFKHLTFDEARNGVTYKGQKVKFKYDRHGGWEAKI